MMLASAPSAIGGLSKITKSASERSLSISSSILSEINESEGLPGPSPEVSKRRFGMSVWTTGIAGGSLPLLLNRTLARPSWFVSLKN